LALILAFEVQFEDPSQSTKEKKKKKDKLISHQFARGGGAGGAAALLEDKINSSPVLKTSLKTSKGTPEN
jgi:hypothetical protein